MQQAEILLQQNEICYQGAIRASIRENLVQTFFRVRSSKNRLLRPVPQKNPHDVIGNVTPERFSKLKSSGSRIQVTDIKNDRGDRTGNKRKRIISSLELLLQRGTISQNEHDAGKVFKKDWYFGMKPPSLVPLYEPRIDCEQRLSPEERRAFHQRRFMAAQMAVDEKFHYALGWLILLLVDPVPLTELGKFYAPAVSERQQRTVGGFALRMALWDLCAHYGLKQDIGKSNLLRLLKTHVRTP